MQKMLKELKAKDWIVIVLVFILTCTQIWLDLKIPEYMSGITMLVQTDGSAISEIILSGVYMLLCSFGGLLIAIIIAIAVAYTSANFSFNLREKIFKKVMSFSMKEINDFSAASLITRTTNDITQVQMLIVMGMNALIRAPLTAGWAVYKIAGKNMVWTMATIIAVFILLLIIGNCIRLAIPKFQQLQELTDDINRVTKENLDGLSVVRAYNAEAYQNGKFKVANDNLTDAHIFVTKVMSLLMPTVQGTSNFLVLAIYFLGAILINAAIGMNKMILFSDMVVFSSYAMQVIMSFMMLVMVFMMLPRASVSAKRIAEILETEESIIPGQVLDGKQDQLGEIEFKNVNFKYGDGQDYVLKDISFKAEKGETVAFIGSTGCGKTTLVNLVPRFYDVNSGEVLVNGVNVKDYEKKALNKLIGYVSQKAILFSGTIAENITYGTDFYGPDFNKSDSKVHLNEGKQKEKADSIVHLNEGTQQGKADSIVHLNEGTQQGKADHPEGHGADHPEGHRPGHPEGHRSGHPEGHSVLLNEAKQQGKGYGETSHAQRFISQQKGTPENELALTEALETSQAKEFVSQQTGKRYGIVSQGGSNFSGGQKQRLSIARAIYRKPAILIFDDSFSALDYKTDRVLRQELNRRAKDSTRLIIGQRIGTIRDCDKIIVLDGGEIAGIGKHAELLKTCEVYKQIALSQLSEEELA